jgi:thioredoxin reductase
MFDVAIVGGGTAGLSAALVLGRARRNVLLLDGGSPRNEPAQAAHGFFTRDGTAPLDLLEIGREQLEPYPVQVWQAEVADAHQTDEGFELALTDGRGASARKLILATGVVDELPDIPSVREFWGRGVFHCPYCHGWEVRERPWAILHIGSMAFERAALFLNWTPHLLLLTNGEFTLEDSERQRLLALGVRIDERPIADLEGSPDGGELRAVKFEDGPDLAVAALFIAPPQRLRSGLADSLDCKIAEIEPVGWPLVETDPLTGETSTAGVYAAGDAVTTPSQSLILAAASGARAAYFSNHALALEDAQRTVDRAMAGQR